MDNKEIFRLSLITQNNLDEIENQIKNFGYKRIAFKNLSEKLGVDPLTLCVQYLEYLSNQNALETVSSGLWKTIAKIGDRVCFKTKTSDSYKLGRVVRKISLEDWYWTGHDGLIKSDCGEEIEFKEIKILNILY